SEDLLQDCFLRLRRYASSFQEEARFLPWAWQIARRVLADERDRARRQGIAIFEEEAAGQEDRDPAYLRELGERQRQLKRALLRLPAEQRELILLSKLRELSVSDLARLFGCSEAAVKVRVHRALQRLHDYCDVPSRVD